MTPRGGAAAVVMSSLLLAGCATSQGPMVYYGGATPPSLATVDSLLERSPLAATENIRITEIGRSEAASHHLVQVRGREEPHRHLTHDSTVFFVRGFGTLVVGDDRVKVWEGSVVYIPRGVTHYFINREKTPATAYVIFTPPFDGRDRVPAP